jgi:GNAT superfamily N-acetyltransferase
VTVSPPTLLTAEHEIVDFHSGVASLDEWLRRRALANQAGGASRTFVACEVDRVVAYYALASGVVAVAAATGRLRRNMPDPIPVVVLGRMAVNRTHQGQALGRALFRDAALRTLHAAGSIGVRGILVHAVSEEAKAFYLSLGLEPSPLEAMTLMVTLADLRASL